MEGGLASAGSLLSAPRHKEHIVHLNFVRAAKILIRHCQVDRERVMYMQHWLGVDQTKEDGFLDSEHHDNPSSMAQPDVRDVYDLLERRVGGTLSSYALTLTRSIARRRATIAGISDEPASFAIAYP